MKTKIFIQRQKLEMGVQSLERTSTLLQARPWSCDLEFCERRVFVIRTSLQELGICCYDIKSYQIGGYAYKIMSWQISDFVGVLNFVKSKKAIVERPRQPRANY